MAESGFYRFGRMVGGKFRTARWLWTSLAGSDADAIRIERTLGRDMAGVVCEQTPSDTDPDVRALLDGIGERLAQSVRNRQHRFHVTAIAAGQPSAYALPGGFVFVTRSLVELCGRDRDEVAFVIAHEMAHVIRRHAVDRLLSQAAVSAAALAAPARGWLAPWIRKVGVHWLERAYSREQELEADELGMLLMRAAGFDPGGSIRLLQRLGALDPTSDGQGPGAYFSTHPPVEDRVLHLRRRLTDNSPRR